MNSVFTQIDLCISIPVFSLKRMALLPALVIATWHVKQISNNSDPPGAANRPRLNDYVRLCLGLA